MFKSVHPFDQSIVAQYDVLSAAELDKCLETSASAYRHWRKTSFEHRRELILTVAGLLRKNKEKYARLMTLEMGKLLSESTIELEKTIRGCEYYAHHAEDFLRDEIIYTEATKSFVTYQPTGAILGIMPWNFPFWQVFRFALPALMAGNVALLKHAPNVTGCALAIAALFKEAGFPDGVLQSLVIDVDLVERIIASPVVQGVALTGSEYAGSQVASLAGKHIKKSVLELGGSDPFIILSDANLDKTVKVAVQSRMQNAGQSCIAAKRFIVLESIREEFMEKFERGIRALKQGDPFQEGITTGPMARIDLAEKLEQQLQKCIDAGAKLIVGGTRSGCNFTPTLLDNVKQGMPAFEEEIFGPVASVVTVKTIEEAIDVANASRYGLGASVWTEDLKKGEQVARLIESGSVFVNSLMRSDARLPFGGIKKSGYGRELSLAGIREFVNTKTISLT
ncbi:NAD-dependent succinate-semialdehyde dehydrogenase [Pseudochryseolinea flava]|uniref:NAD-dependent succinate-semialdehyde dehydrogenase n=1 Tax=Pseudochryseolinea flava TaxID=2059302 RepID=A0A364XU99_9BACT|nr:NAD-dependent succinate-semialdehyde dehydrogenase [Pseudochryseolinea flava]RAV97889.1 NAD-dependent succinate-semialdehyde dehydrogenase [Pseudochryseolinea flava]